jgi:hypothetical protein
MKEEIMFLVVGSDYRSFLLDELPEEIQVESVGAISECNKFLTIKKMCTTHEEALDAICSKMQDGPNLRAIKLFRNKAALRSKLSCINPEFYFQQIKLDELQNVSLKFDTLEFRYVIKPVKGFFGIGVHFISQNTSLKVLQKKILSEINAQRIAHPSYFINDTLSSNDFLIEQCVGGEVIDAFSFENAEIAIDGFYDKDGQFILLNIYHHPYHNSRKYFHLLYYTSYNLFENFAEKTIIFFNQLRKIIQLEIFSFPLHAEFKVTNGELFLVEINPGRFAGLGLSDLTYYAFGINPYDYFFYDKSFEWKNIIKRNFCFAWVLIYQGENYKGKKSHIFQHEKIIKKIRHNLIKYIPIHYDESVAAVAFLKNLTKEQLAQILRIEFNDFYLIAKS